MPRFFNSARCDSSLISYLGQEDGRELRFAGLSHPGRAEPHVSAVPLLGDAVAKHSKGDHTGMKAPRPNIRLLNRNRFRSLATIEDVAAVLFGLGPISVSNDDVLDASPSPGSGVELEEERNPEVSGPAAS